MSTTVNVQNIAKETDEKHIRDFFSFCGKISDLSVKEEGESTKSAKVTFEKETAAKTALLLDNTQLGSAQVHVTIADSHSASSSEKATGAGQNSNSNDDDVAQEDKPRSRIIAEYLAHGYVISDHIIERALAVDKQHGLYDRFTSALRSFDERLHATASAHAVDSRLGVTDRATGAWRGLSSYFDQALDTPTGRRLRAFYEMGNKQVVDVHNEARHLADLKSGKSSTAGSSTGAGKEGSGLHQVEGTNRTKCNCCADLGKCPCESGKCACNDCPKNADLKKE